MSEHKTIENALKRNTHGWSNAERGPLDVKDIASHMHGKAEQAQKEPQRGR